MSRLKQPVAILLAAVLMSPDITTAGELRTWRSADGKEIEATLISASREEVHFKLKNGREARVPLSRLSEKDRQYLADLDKQGLAFAVGEMPEETKAPAQIDVEGGPRIFKTPHFEFHTDHDVTKAFISEAARVYEGTFVAIQSLPLGLKLTPPEGMERYRGIFLNDSAFNSRFGNQSPIPFASSQRVAGVYVPADKELLVPYSSLGAKRSGSQITLRRTSDTTTLIHEISHQVMHEWLPFIPVWMAEGLSEYIAAVPYQNGRFEFKNSERGLKERLKEKYRLENYKIQSRFPPSTLIGRGTENNVEPTTTTAGSSTGAISTRNQLAPSVNFGSSKWGGSIEEYRDSMLLFYFFIHLDREEAPGAPVAAYLKLIDRARNETDQFIAEYNQNVTDFEKKRLAYNEGVKKFNNELELYRIAVTAYNTRIKQLNQEILEGVPENERIRVGEPPLEPTPPEKLVVPEILKNSPKPDGPLDIISITRERATHALLRGRSPEQLNDDFVKAMAEIGIEISIR